MRKLVPQFAGTHERKMESQRRMRPREKKWNRGEGRVGVRTDAGSTNKKARF
jgi:hypothetical protein